MEKFLVEYKSAVEKKLAEYKCNTNTAIELKLGMYAFPKQHQTHEGEFCVRAVVYDICMAYFFVYCNLCLVFYTN